MNLKRYNALILAAIAILLTGMWTHAIPAREQPSNDSKASIKVDVDLVLVNAAVTDPEGRTVTGSNKEKSK